MANVPTYCVALVWWLYCCAKAQYEIRLSGYNWQGWKKTQCCETQNNPFSRHESCTL